MNYGHAPVRPLPRPILPRDRGVIDRMMDLFVGDGPHQRYALICRHCSGHNGMALQEEFEYVSYYCCYCFMFNPPRKLRPTGPRLAVPNPPAPIISSVKDTEERKVEETINEKCAENSENSGDSSGDETPTDDESEEPSSNKVDDQSEANEEMEVDTPEEEKGISDDAGQDTSSLR